MQQIFDYSRHNNVKARVKQDILSEFNYCCAYCRSKSERLTLDHVLAESKGGIDSRKNLVPACAKCNRSKGSLNLTSWYTQQKPFYSPERLQRILNRCDVKIWADQTGYAKGFAPISKNTQKCQ